ncbi:MAG TPA: prepilin-type N-terminal cleavage/methylation domain-containing protein, partial [Candidatus Baltobacteraceae bacterium]|nr:prepilin-type N-terminal cleavage/methylation domain-containing protein [Candidatus Baltobacteraceae bacterium]
GALSNNVAADVTSSALTTLLYHARRRRRQGDVPQRIEAGTTDNMEPSRARGFTLLEVVISLALVALLAYLLLHVLGGGLAAARLQSERDVEQSTIGSLVDDLTEEEDDAWAIYNAPTDVLGQSNADGHEVDFFERDGKQRTYFWCYNYNAMTRTLTRYRFSFPGAVPQRDVVYTGITDFSSHTYPITAMQDPSTPVYSSLYSGAHLQSGIVRFYASTMPWIQGGNNVTYVHIETPIVKQDLQLVTQTAPSGFTVVLWYTPSPKPSATALPAFKTWPADLVLGASGAPVNLTSGALADASPKMWVAREINALFGGGTALAASPCYAMAMDTSGTAPDASIDGTPAQTALGVHVDSNGCEVDSSDAPLTTPVVVAWEPSGTSETFAVQSNTCANAQVGPWKPYSGTGVNLELDAAGKAAASCTVTLSDGVSTQTPTADNGSIGVKVWSMSLVEVGSGDSCEVISNGNGIVKMNCSGRGSATYGPNCAATGVERESITSGNGSGSGQVWAMNQAVMLSSLPTTTSGWATLLNNGVTDVLRSGGGVVGNRSTIVAGCPL